MPFSGDFIDLRNPKSGLIEITNLTRIESELVEFMKSKMLPSLKDEDDNTKNEFKELGFNILEKPKLEKTKFSRVGHALSTYISEKKFNLEVPVHPWAIILGLDQDLPNADALCFDQQKNLIWLEAKTSLNSTNLSNQISKLKKELESKNIEYFLKKINLFQRHYKNYIPLSSVLHPLFKFKNGDKSSFTFLGFFISPDNNLNIGSKFETDLNYIIPILRRNVDYPSILESSERIFTGLMSDD